MLTSVPPRSRHTGLASIEGRSETVVGSRSTDGERPFQAVWDRRPVTAQARSPELKRNLIAVPIAHATNLGLVRMAEACGVSYDVLAWTAE